jgi:hypothetical protein
MHHYPHGRHEWREGFLWLRKRVCHGIPKHGEDFMGRPIVAPHRHFYKVGYKNYFMISWDCVACTKTIIMSRLDYQDAVLNNIKIKEAVGACGKLDAECTC